MLRGLLIVGVITAAPLGNSPRPETVSNPHKTEGKWRLISVECQGQVVQPAPETAPRWIIRANQVAIRTDPGIEQTLTVKWNAASTPAEVDVIDDGATTLRGIYQITGQRMILCAGSAGRPAGFARRLDCDERRIILERE